MKASRRRAAHGSWMTTPWPWARKTTWRDDGRCRAASRPQAGGVSQSKVPLSSRVGTATLTGWRSEAAAAGAAHTGQKAGDLLGPELKPEKPFASIIFRRA